MFGAASIAQEQGWPLEGSQWVFMTIEVNLLCKQSTHYIKVELARGTMVSKALARSSTSIAFVTGIRWTRKEGNRVLEVHRVFRLPRKFGTGFVQVEVSTLPALVGRSTRDW